MRTLLIAAAALAASATAALAAPATVSVSVGPEMEALAVETYGVRDVERLADELREAVERRLARTGALQDAHVELVLVHARPNRPTFKQLSDTPGLSLQSFGIGGAEIGGRVVAADGSVSPVSYRWYETDIRNAYASATWTDAGWTFQRFAGRLARGGELAAR